MNVNSKSGPHPSLHQQSGEVREWERRKAPWRWTVEEVRESINARVRERGYFCISYLLEKRVGQIAPISFDKPVGNCVILGPATAEEHKEFWGMGPEFPYCYKAMVD